MKRLLTFIFLLWTVTANAQFPLTLPGAIPVISGGGGGPTTIIHDTYSAGDETTLVDHIIAPTNTPATDYSGMDFNSFKILTNRLYMNSSGVGRYLVDGGAGNGIITMDWRDDAGGSNVQYGVYFRCSSDYQNGYRVRVMNETSEIQLQRIDGGTETQVDIEAFGAYATGVTYTWKVTLNGTAITCDLYNGATLLETVTYTDPSYTANDMFGIFVFSSVDPVNQWSDNLKFTTLSFILLLLIPLKRRK